MECDLKGRYNENQQPIVGAGQGDGFKAPPPFSPELKVFLLIHLETRFTTWRRWSSAICYGCTTELLWR